MAVPTIYYDPTSEPCRAIHWLCLAADIPHKLETVWLTRGEHRREEFLRVNPRHQLPAMQHGDFCLSEATAIMRYLVELNDSSTRWFGGSLRHRALINSRLSWYHTNLRTALTLNYFLPVLFMPACLGFDQPSDEAISTRLKALHGTFKHMDGMLREKTFLSGEAISVADILFASEVTALKIDSNYSEIMSSHSEINRWLEALEQLPAYLESHRAWNYVVPRILATTAEPGSDPGWVADACENIIA